MKTATSRNPKVNVAIVSALTLIVVSLISQCATKNSAEPLPNSTLQEGKVFEGKVVSVTDGDTLKIRIGDTTENVRLIGIDTPETHGPAGLKECFGNEASSHLSELLPKETPVKVALDKEPRDRYERLLAYVYRSSDETFVNMTQVRQGFAVVLRISPNVAFSDQFAAAETQARNKNLGLWSACGGADVALE